MSALTHDTAMTALREVQDPELHRSIVDLGMVGDVAVEEGRVRVATASPWPAARSRPRSSAA